MGFEHKQETYDTSQKWAVAFAELISAAVLDSGVEALVPVSVRLGGFSAHQRKWNWQLVCRT